MGLWKVPKDKANDIKAKMLQAITEENENAVTEATAAKRRRVEETIRNHVTTLMGTTFSISNEEMKKMVDKKIISSYNRGD